MAFRIRRGTNAERQAYTPAIGEPIWTTDTNRLWIGDGVTAGGIAVDAESYLTNEYLQDLTAAMFTTGGHNGITFSYDDNTGRVIATVNFPPIPPSSGGSFHFNVTGVDSTLKQINGSETIQFTGSNGINVTVDDTGATTIINVDGSVAVPSDISQLTDNQGLLGSANLDEVGFFITGLDSTQTKINNSETLRFVGGNGNTISINDTGVTTELTITSPIGINSETVFAIPFYSGYNTYNIDTSGPDARFMPEFATFDVNRISTNSIVSVLITTPFNILNIQPNTPIVGRATITFGPTHPHPPYYNDRHVRIENVSGGGSSWNGTWTTRPSGEGDAGSVNTLIIVSSNTDAYTSGGTIHETDPESLNLFPTGDNPFVQFGGVLDFNNSQGPVEYPAKFRLIDSVDYGVGNSFATAELIQSHNSTEVNSFNFIRARGTLLTPSSVQNGDELGAISFTGSDNVNNPLQNGLYFPASAQIIGLAAETPAAINGSPGIAGELRFKTASPGSGYNLFDGLIIDKSQTVKVPSKLEISETIRISGNQIETISSSANLDIRTNGSGTINLLENVNITGTLNVPIIDTADSSSITIVPAAVFNSDVTIENDLNVSDKIYANEFVSTSVGTPEIVTSSNFKVSPASQSFYFNTNGTYQLPVLTSTPGSPASGMVAIADGTSWNPTMAPGKQQMVVYLGGGWRQIAVEP
jgi:hypothetical protein